MLIKRLTPRITSGIIRLVRISIFGGKNETVAFQLILEDSTNSPVNSADVSLPLLSNGTTTIQNTSSDPTAFVGRYIELFVVSYDSITVRSRYDGNEGNGSSKALPDTLWTGVIPDALIPFEAPVKSPAHGMGGAPFTIPPHRCQSVWCDVYIPKTSTSGNYTGTISVSVSGSQVYSIPLTLTVYNFTLSDSTHCKVWWTMGREGFSNRYAGTSISWNSAYYQQLHQKYSFFGHRHRLTLADGHENASDFSSYVADYYTNAAYSAANGYSGPGEGVGNSVYSIGTYDLGNTNNNGDSVVYKVGPPHK